MIFIRENIASFFIFTLAIVTSIVCFIALRNVYPTPMELLLGHTIYGLIALPNSFLHMIQFYPDNSAHSDLLFYGLAALYWAIIVTAHFWYAEEPEPKYMAVVAFFVLVGAPKWLYFASAIMQHK